MRRLPAAASLAAAFALATLAAPAHAAIVHGLEHSPMGGATITVVGSGFADRALEVGNLGSSGQDGVSIALPGSNGLHVTFGAPPTLPTNPIVHRDLALRTMSGGAPVTLCELSADQVGPDCVLTPQSPGASSMRVDVWNGAQLVYSVHHPPGTPVTMLMAAVDEPGTQMGAWTQSAARGNCCRGHVIIMKRTAATDMSVSGTPVTGTSVSFAFEHGADPARATEARIRGASGGGGGGAGGMLITEVLPAEFSPPDAPDGTLPVALDVISGALLSSSAAGIAVSPDGTGDPVQVSLNGLPPGEPVIRAPLQSAAIELSADYMTGAGPSSLTLECVTEADDGSGLPPVSTTDLVTWTAASPTQFDASVTRGLPGLPDGALILFGGLETAHAAGPFTLSTDHPPLTLRAQVLHGDPVMCFGFPDGTLATLNGASSACDSIVIPLPFPAANLGRSIRDVRLVHPPGTPPGTWRAFHTTPFAQSGMDLGTPYGNGSGLGAFAKEAPKDTTKKPVRIRSLGIGSSGEDGVYLRVPSGGSIGLELPTDDAALARAAALEFKQYPCAGVDCDFSSRLAIEGLDGSSSVARLASEFPAHGANPLYVEAAGRVASLSSADADGDGWMDLSCAAPGGVRVDRVELRRWAPRVESQSVRFASPVTITIRGDLFVTSDVTVWRNRGGGNDGADSPEPVVLRVAASPPAGGTTPGVCELETGPPLVQCAGPSVGAPGVPSTFNGHPIVPTWVSVSGDLEIGDLDGDGFPELFSNNPHAVGVEPPPTTLATTFRSTLPLGAVLWTDLPSVVAAGGSVGLSFRLDGTRSMDDGEIRSFRVDAGAAGTTLSADIVEPGSDLVWSPRSNLVEQGSFTGTGPLLLTAPPTTLEYVGDLDGDGMPDLRCSGFPPGTQCFLGGVAHPCDEVVVSVTGGSPVDALTGARVMVHKLHRGHHLPSVRLAEYGDPPASLAAPGAAPVAAFALSAPSPNPFARATAIAFALGDAARVRVRVLDVAGREIARLADGRFEAGAHRLEWDGRTTTGVAAAAGLYFVRFERDGAEPRVARVARLR